MKKPRLILCSGADLPPGEEPPKDHVVVRLATTGSDANVTLQLEDLAKKFLSHVSPRLIDLLELAAYVYAADCKVKRDGVWSDPADPEPWGRKFKFVLPVRDVAFWNQQGIRKLLAETLNFLSDDAYEFSFISTTQPDVLQSYFALGEMDEWPFQNIERVTMFSGGLDSLAGIAETASKNEKLVLVSHRPVSTKDNHQRELFRELSTRFANQLIHVPVWVNKNEGISREHTQRARSFLYVAIGAAVAHSVNAKGVRFFENGVVSLNLPLADEVLRARASRTTHPRVLQMFSRLLTFVLDRDFVVDNPYLFKTKTEIVSIIASSGCAELIGKSVSCSHSIFRSKSQQHCGTCSQCIDRRIAVLAAGQGAHDPETDYEQDVFVGKRKPGYEVNIGIDYIRTATELHQWDERQIAAKFNRELSSAVRDMNDRSGAAQRFVAMFKRHGDAVAGVMRSQIALHSDALLSGKLERTSMLAKVMGMEHQLSCWKRYAARIVGILRTGLASACETHEPENETHLQQLCDGILHGSSINLRREFPYLCWSSRLTKPDYYVEGYSILIELKYVRDKADIPRTVSAIAEDITKYGDNDYRVLFVVYDKHGHISDTDEFVAPVEKHPKMIIEIVR
ncbi:MAG TPA: hypothetical protein VGP72_00510 [Planctomycetota bacterium]|jgi:hypothetical protein